MSAFPKGTRVFVEHEESLGTVEGPVVTVQASPKQLRARPSEPVHGDDLPVPDEYARGDAPMPGDRW